MYMNNPMDVAIFVTKVVDVVDWLQQSGLPRWSDQYILFLSRNDPSTEWVGNLSVILI